MSQFSFQGPSVFNFMAAVILEPKKIVLSLCLFFFPSIFYEVMGLDAMILVFWMLSFKPAFSLSSLPSQEGL